MEDPTGLHRGQNHSASTPKTPRNLSPHGWVTAVFRFIQIHERRFYEKVIKSQGRRGGRSHLFLPVESTPVGRFGEQSRDRKSTRLNHSHANISYAVFC